MLQYFLFIKSKIYILIIGHHFIYKWDFMNIILNIQGQGQEMTAGGQIQPAACFSMASELRMGFTFISGWKKNQKNHRL